MQIEWQSSTVTGLRQKGEHQQPFFACGHILLFYHLLLPNRADTFYNASMSFATTLHRSLLNKKVSN